MLVRFTVICGFGFWIAWSISCSFPNMEDPRCAAARGTVRELFSYHFGGDMRFSAEALPAYERYLTPEFTARLKNAPSGVDPFTLAPDDDPPKAFSVGKCTAASQQADLRVLLFWKTDTRSEQRELNVEAVMRGDKWLVNGISKP